MNLDRSAGTVQRTPACSRWATDAHTAADASISPAHHEAATEAMPSTPIPPRRRLQRDTEGVAGWSRDASRAGCEPASRIADHPAGTRPIGAKTRQSVPIAVPLVSGEGRSGRDYRGENWWARQDSNLQPDRYERSALTIELQALRLFP